VNNVVRQHKLSAREREILLWACRGKTYREIAAIHGLAFGSVKTYLDSARHKLNVANLPQACAVAAAEGILTREEIMAGYREKAD
jgi:DNA-binding CsgD family transcriptional regulator